MPSYKVDNVLGKEEWKGKESMMVTYDMEVIKPDGDTARVLLTQQPKTPVPTIGQVIDGELEDTPKGTRLRKAKAAFSSGSNGGGRTEDPKKSAEIRRMWALGQAIALVTAEVRAGLKFENEKPAALVTPRADWLEAQVKEAGERA